MMDMEVTFRGNKNLERSAVELYNLAILAEEHRIKHPTNEEPDFSFKSEYLQKVIKHIL